MIKKFQFRMRLGDHFIKAVLAITVLAALVVAAKMTFFKAETPSLQQVLTLESLDPQTDYSMIIISLLAFSFATLSAAKGYEVIKKSKCDCASVLAEEKKSLDAERKLSENLKQGELNVLRNEIEDLKKTKQGLLNENTELKNRFKTINTKYEELQPVEKMLRDSNISLGRECERLKHEKEALSLKLNALMKPKKSHSTGSGQAKKKAAKGKTLAKKRKITNKRKGAKKKA
ncbi:MAG: hypothetical protein KKA31_04070 [Candidatus Margulisbacteria bacterium]|nr:hypothetical protein [Candidatus Margulisiibacteriota bacterium]